MKLRNGAGRYGWVAMALHWSVAFLVLLQYPLALYMDALPIGWAKFAAVNWHKSVGVTLLLLATLRLLWRLIDPPPPLPREMPRWERLAAHTSHLLLYLLLFAMPLLGLLRAFTSGFPTELYGAFRLPSPLATDQAMSDLFSWLHFFGALALAGLVMVHVAAALRHHFLRKDEVLRRMLPGGR